MPILEIEITGERHADQGAEHQLVQRLADAAACVLTPGRIGATWVRLRWTQHRHYGEGGCPPAQTPSPVFVRLLVAAWPDEPTRASLSAQLCEALAPLCRRAPSLVHLLWEPPAAGRVAFGGRLLPSTAASSQVLD